MSDIDQAQLLDLLRFKTLRGFERFGYPKTARYIERLDYELGVIDKTGFAPYFLMVGDLCRFMREKKIRFIARGSGCGSVVVWGLGISHRWLDPVMYKIPFERFLNLQRISNPDIDIDIQDDRRHEVVQYTIDKYGADKVARICTFGTLAPKMATKDFARALNIPDYQTIAQEIADLIPLGKGDDGKNHRMVDLLKRSEALQAKEKQYPDLFKYVMKADGKVRQAGIHAAGTIIAPDRITKFLPLLFQGNPENRDESEWQPTTQWDMYDVEERGLVKMDYLGLKTLRVIDFTEKMVNALRKLRDEPEDFDIDFVPQDDAKSWQLVNDGKLLGIFQVERTFVQNFARRMNLLNKHRRVTEQWTEQGFIDLTWSLAVLVAIIRPGMMDGSNSGDGVSNTEHYLRRAMNQEPVTPLHSLLAETFIETYGLMAFQEDVMSCCVDLSGFTRAEADVIRKGVGKKAPEFIKKQQPMFFEGAMQPRVKVTTHKNVDGKVVERVWKTKPRNPELKAMMEKGGWKLTLDPTGQMKLEHDGKARVYQGGEEHFQTLVFDAPGATREEAQYIWEQIEAHSRYSFNNAHAAAYGMVISYQTAYLKANHTLPFMTALINSEAGVSHKDAGYNYKVAEYVEEARSMGLKVLPPSVTRSAEFCTLVAPFENELRFGLSLIKKVSGGAVDWIVKNCRNVTNLKEFVLACYDRRQIERKMDVVPEQVAGTVDGQVTTQVVTEDASTPKTEWRSYCTVGKSDLEALAAAGALDCFDKDRARLKAMLPKLSVLSAKYHEQLCKINNGSKKLKLTPEALLKQIEDFRVDEGEYREMTLEQILDEERQFTGCYLSESPFAPFTNEIRKFCTCTPVEIDEGMVVDGPMQFAALVADFREIVVKKGKNIGQPMAIMTLRGINGDVEAPAFCSVWGKLRQPEGFIQRGKVYVVHVKPDMNGKGVIIENMWRLSRTD